MKVKDLVFGDLYFSTEWGYLFYQGRPLSGSLFLFYGVGIDEFGSLIPSDDFVVYLTRSAVKRLNHALLWQFRDFPDCK